MQLCSRSSPLIPQDSLIFFTHCKVHVIPVIGYILRTAARGLLVVPRMRGLLLSAEYRSFDPPVLVEPIFPSNCGLDSSHFLFLCCGNVMNSLHLFISDTIDLDLESFWIFETTIIISSIIMNFRAYLTAIATISNNPPTCCAAMNVWWHNIHIL